MSVKDGCDNKDCVMSITPKGKFSFGSGKRFNGGYWEFPCPLCARAWEQMSGEKNCYPSNKLAEMVSCCVLYPSGKINHYFL
jgi:hypothetical protein